MVKMIATKPHTFGGKVIQADEEFEVDEQYAGTLVSLGRAVIAEEGKGKTKKASKAKPMTSAEEAGEDAKTYQTRQIKAEDE